MKPWPALQKFAEEKTGDLASLSPHDLGHIPYVLLLLHFLRQWQLTHSGALPKSYKEKSEFRDMLRNAAPLDEENFAEAAAAVLKSLNPPTPSSAVQSTLNAPEADNLTPDSSSFWYIAKAIKTFYQEHGELPLPGALPDMKAQSSDYIALQNIYKSKAREDCAEVAASVRTLEKQHSRSKDQSTPLSEIEAFCKGSAHIKLVRGSPSNLARALDPLAWEAESAKSAVNALMLPGSGILTYMAFLAYDKFVSTHDVNGLSGAPKAPGAQDTEVTSDGDKLVSIACAVLDAAIKAAGTFVENPMYDEAKEELASICREL